MLIHTNIYNKREHVQSELRGYEFAICEISQAFKSYRIFSVAGVIQMVAWLKESWCI